MNIFYFDHLDPKDNKPRKIAVSYTYDSATNTVSYGASVWRKDSEKDLFKKDSVLSTAKARCNLRPVKFKLKLTTDNHALSQIREAIKLKIINCNYMVRDRSPRSVNSILLLPN